MKKCKMCGKSMPKSRISSEYCLDCDDKIQEWIKLGKAAKTKLEDGVKAKGKEVVDEVKRSLKAFLKDGEKLLREFGKMLED